MIKSIFIVNPKSGNGRGAVIGKKIETFLATTSENYEIVYTTHPKHAIKIADSYIKTDNVQLIAVGGDGTMNEVLNGIHLGVVMGIIPCGSGNDFFRMIDPKIKDFNDLVISTIHGREQSVDYGILNNYKFLGSFSVGFDAKVVMKVHELRGKSNTASKNAYLKAVFNVVANSKGFNVLFEEKNIHLKQKCLLISALNGCYYGGGFKAAPYSVIDDGKFDVCIIDDVKRSEIVRLLPVYMMGKHYGNKIVTTLLTNRFSITCDEQVPAQCDGEVFISDKFDLEVVNNGVSILVPRRNV